MCFDGRYRRGFWIASSLVKTGAVASSSSTRAISTKSSLWFRAASTPTRRWLGSARPMPSLSISSKTILTVSTWLSVTAAASPSRLTKSWILILCSLPPSLESPARTILTSLSDRSITGRGSSRLGSISWQTGTWHWWWWGTVWSGSMRGGYLVVGGRSLPPETTRTSKCMTTTLLSLTRLWFLHSCESDGVDSDCVKGMLQSDIIWSSWVINLHSCVINLSNCSIDLLLAMSANGFYLCYGIVIIITSACHCSE